MSEDARATKGRLREQIRGLLREFASPLRKRADETISQGLESLAFQREVDYVLGYLALPDEVRIDLFLASMVERGVRILLPRVEGGGLRFAAWRPCSVLVRGRHGVLAPAVEGLRELPSGQGLLVIPGRAFDAGGARLGRGGGYYDRLLDGTQVQAAVGAAYECQIVASVPREGHDRSVPYIVTEQGLRSAQPGQGSGATVGRNVGSDGRKGFA